MVDEGGFDINMEVFGSEVETIESSQLPEMVGIRAGTERGGTSRVGWNSFIHFETTFHLMEGREIEKNRARALD